MILQTGPTQPPGPGSMEPKLQEIKTNPYKAMIITENQSVHSDTRQLIKIQQ